MELVPFPATGSLSCQTLHTWQRSANVRVVPSPANALAFSPDLPQAAQPGLVERVSCPSTLVSSAGSGVLEWVRGKGEQPRILMANWIPVTNAASGGPTINSVWLDVTWLIDYNEPSPFSAVMLTWLFHSSRYRKSTVGCKNWVSNL